MKIAQLIEVTETTLYLKDGVICNIPEKDQSKLLHMIFGETRLLRTEEIIKRWRIKTKAEADNLFWQYISENNLDSRNYYIVYSEQ